MKISGVKKIEQKIFKNSKGDLLKFVSKKSKYFKSFGEIYFNEIKQNKKKGWIQHKKNHCLFSVAYGEVNFKLIDGRKKSRSFEVEEKITLSKNSNLNLAFKKYSLLFFLIFRL